MRQVDGGVFLNEPNIGLIAEALRSIFNEGIAKECGVTLPGVKVVHKNTREAVWPLAQGQTKKDGPDRPVTGRR